MKVLTIKEPFATLISKGIKKIETRSWKTKYRGKLYIHAGLSKDYRKIDEINKIIKDLNFNYGKIICEVELVDCIYMTEEFIEKLKKNNKIEYLVGHYEVGRYAWILDNVKLLDKKIDAKGKLSIWNYTIDKKQ